MQDRKPITVGVRMTTDLAAQIREIAKADDRTPSAVARRIIAEHLAKRQTATMNEGGSMT